MEEWLSERKVNAVIFHPIHPSLLSDIFPLFKAIQSEIIMIISINFLYRAVQLP